MATHICAVAEEFIGGRQDVVIVSSTAEKGSAEEENEREALAAMLAALLVDGTASDLPSGRDVLFISGTMDPEEVRTMLDEIVEPFREDFGADGVRRIHRVDGTVRVRSNEHDAGTLVAMASSELISTTHGVGAPFLILHHVPTFGSVVMDECIVPLLKTKGTKLYCVCKPEEVKYWNELSADAMLTRL